MPTDPGDPVREASLSGDPGSTLDDEWVDQSEWVDDVAVAEPVGDGVAENLVGEAGADTTAVGVNAEPAGAVATMRRGAEPAPEPEPAAAVAAAEPASEQPHTEPMEPTEPEPLVAASAASERPRVGIAAIAFGAAIVLLAAAIPVLTWVGYRFVVTSRAGVINSAAEGPGAGATQVLPPTPTELVVFTDTHGHPVSYSMLSLNNGAHGGAVVSIPATTKLPVAAYGLTRLDVAYAFGGQRTLQQSLTSIVDFTVGGNIRIGPTEAAALVHPLGQLTVDNPVDVDGPDGSFSSGQLQLQPSEVVSYLAATNTSDPLAQMKTQQAFWRAWLAAVGHSPAAANAATNLDTRLGHFADVMTTGAIRYNTLPVTSHRESDPNRGSTEVFTVDQGRARVQMLAAVPFPMAPIDLRPQVELYNGYDRRGISPAIMQRVVFAGGQLLLVGTSGNLGRDTTELHYGDPSMVPEVDQVRAALGTGKLVLDPTIASPGEVTILCGKDLIAHPPTALVGAGG